MNEPQAEATPQGDMILAMTQTGYSETAARYFLTRPHMGRIENADQVSDFVGSCGDTMTIYLKLDGQMIEDVKYEVMGCAGAISAAMAAVDIIKGKSMDFARNINDGDIFKTLENIPEKKHHCIQLAVKTLHKAIDEYRSK
ncbi:MAG: iron-sulfur cluster assembly scaffold protein [Proteobacteria bacterium]|nr:iron-sulfur cluster assembly scaffold protein [Pseudomonadota bacterium]